MPLAFFGIEADPTTKSPKDKVSRTPSSNQKLQKLPPGSFIVFGSKESVSNVGPKAKGELSGSEIKVKNNTP